MALYTTLKLKNANSVLVYETTDFASASGEKKSSLWLFGMFYLRLSEKSKQIP